MNEKNIERVEMVRDLRLSLTKSLCDYVSKLTAFDCSGKSEEELQIYVAQIDALPQIVEKINDLL